MDDKKTQISDAVPYALIIQPQKLVPGKMPTVPYLDVACSRNCDGWSTNALVFGTGCEIVCHQFTIIVCYSGQCALCIS